MIPFFVSAIAGFLLGIWPAHAERIDFIQVLPQTALNIGEFRAEETRQATFRLVNQGRDPVRISKVRAGCSCTAVATYSQDAIPPRRQWFCHPENHWQQPQRRSIRTQCNNRI